MATVAAISSGGSELAWLPSPKRSALFSAGGGGVAVGECRHRRRIPNATRKRSRDDSQNPSATTLAATSAAGASAPHVQFSVLAWRSDPRSAGARAGPCTAHECRHFCCTQGVVVRLARESPAGALGGTGARLTTRRRRAQTRSEARQPVLGALRQPPKHTRQNGHVFGRCGSDREAPGS